MTFDTARIALEKYQAAAENLLREPTEAEASERKRERLELQLEKARLDLLEEVRGRFDPS
jgi:hypothetical protein